MNSVAKLERVVVLGGSGFIGRSLVRRLRGTGDWDVESWSSAECDLLSDDVAERLGECGQETSMVMCAGATRAREDDWDTYCKNVTMAHHVAGVIASGPCRSFVFLSSTDVYGLPAAELPISESTLPRPISFYGLSKLASESVFGILRDPATVVTCLRLPGIYGPGDNGQSVVGRFCRKACADERLQVSGNGQVRRDYVHVDDLCGLLEQLLVDPVDDTLNVATGRAVTIAELAALAGRAADREPRLEISGARTARDHDLVFDVSRLKRRCPRAEFRDVAAGVEQYVAQMGRPES